jgi:hypothetical protein
LPCRRSWVRVPSSAPHEPAGNSGFYGLVAFILGVTYLSGAYLVSRDRRVR